MGGGQPNNHLQLQWGWGASGTKNGSSDMNGPKEFNSISRKFPSIQTNNRAKEGRMYIRAKYLFTIAYFDGDSSVWSFRYRQNKNYAAILPPFQFDMHKKDSGDIFGRYLGDSEENTKKVCVSMLIYNIL